MIRIIHVSDLHLVKDDFFWTGGSIWDVIKSTVQPKNNHKQVSVLCKLYEMYFSSNAEAGNNYLLVTGDLTDDGSEKQYEVARGILAPLFKGRLLVCPGNHDYDTGGMFQFKKKIKYFQELVGDTTDSVKKKVSLNIIGDSDTPKYSSKVPFIWTLSSPDCKLLTCGLNSVYMYKHAFEPDWGAYLNKVACGVFTTVQLDRLEAILNNSAYSAYTKLLYFHHRPVINTDSTLEMLAEDRIRLLELCRKYDVSVLCYGHAVRKGTTPSTTSNWIETQMETEDWATPEIVYSNGDMNWLEGKVNIIEYENNAFVKAYTKAIIPPPPQLVAKKVPTSPPAGIAKNEPPPPSGVA